MSLTLLDWRRQVASIYARVRAEPDPRVAHQLWVDRRQQLFTTHPDSADRDASLRHAPYDAAMRFVVEVDTDVEPQRLEIPTATDGVVPFERFGRVHLGDVGSLDVWWLASYGGGIWLPLRDANPDTYGGGRYLLDTVKGADLGGEVDPSTGRGTLVVDLNFAYNPSCAYDERWACPLAPAGNVIDGSIDAGELVPAG
ncbi:MAG TPA: DUF1684 domain-containing protein [Mycobacteriales bacterium]|nr:DUF1684 domain-containing protein [Mycobacteriales bacterium]